MKKTIAWILTAAMLLLLLVMPAGAVPDVGEDLQDPIEVLRLLGVVSGFPDGTFRPTAQLTRAQFCKMAVVLMGRADEADLYKNYTIYPDVRSSHWAAGYINFAVKSLGLLRGMPDGTFRPEDKITFAQAVTILVRVLGYSDSDVGFLWPSGYIKKGAAIQLTKGLPTEPNHAMDRALGVKLFYNLLNTKTKSGAAFLSTVAGSVRENVILLETNAPAPDGTSGAVLLAGDTAGIKSVMPIPERFEGRRGTVALNKDGLITTFVPAEGSIRRFVLGVVAYPTVRADSGESYTLKSDTPVYQGGIMKPFVQVSYDLTPGTQMELLLTPSGAVDYLVVRESEQPTMALVLTVLPTESALRAMLGAPSNAKILKNGSLCTATDLRKYDVVTYSATTNTCTVSDFKLTGVYEFAHPNTTVPSKITLLGKEFDVISQAIETLKPFKLGDPMTLLFTADGRVAAAVPYSDLRVQTVGFYTGTSIDLLSGHSLTVPATMPPAGIPAGTLVRLYAYRPNDWQITRIQDNSPGVSLDLSAGMLGDKKIAASAVFFEKVGPNGVLARIDRADILQAVLPASRVYHAEYDSSGRVIAAILEDVTGDLYSYGLLQYADEESDVPFGDTSIKVNIRYVWVKNSSGDSAKLETVEHPGTTNIWCGIAEGKAGRVARIVELSKTTGISRSNFKENRAIWIGGVLAPIAEDVQVYLKPTGTYMNSSRYTTLEALISDARAFGSSFDVYTEKPPVEGGRVRVLVVNG